MGIVFDEEGATRHVCLECGFFDERASSDRRLTDVET